MPLELIIYSISNKYISHFARQNRVIDFLKFENLHDTQQQNNVEDVGLISHRLLTLKYIYLASNTEIVTSFVEQLSILISENSCSSE